MRWKELVSWLDLFSVLSLELQQKIETMRALKKALIINNIK